MTHTPAVYAFSPYGAPTTYGPGQLAAPGGYISSFSASVPNYSMVLLTYTLVPNTSSTPLWTRYRLVRCRWGYPGDANDGVNLFESTYTSSEFVDTSPLPGYNYYGLFFTTASDVNVETDEYEWFYGGGVSVLVPGSYGSADWLWRNLPLFYRLPQGSAGVGTTINLLAMAGLQLSDANNDLWDFVQVLGFGLDMLRTRHDQLLFARDTTRAHISQVAALARTLGIPTVSRTRPALLRQRVAQGVGVMQERGTIGGLRQWIKLMTGASASVTLSPNLLLDSDQSAFYHPLYPAWSAAIGYPAGDRVISGTGVFQANSGGAYGAAQAPPSSGGNTWWTQVTGNDVAELDNPLTLGGVSTWETYGATSSPSQQSLELLAGVAAVDLSSTTGNALQVCNFNASTPTPATQDLYVRSLSRLSSTSTFPEASQVLRDGIPLPRITDRYAAATDYLPGAYTIWQGEIYRAKVATTGISPTGNASSASVWDQVSVCGRLNYMASFYVHQYGSAAVVPVYPYVDTYDAAGTHRHYLEAYQPLTSPTTLADHFTSAPGAITTGTHLQYTSGSAAATWTLQSGHFNQTAWGDGSLVPADSTITSMITTDTGSADRVVSVTMLTTPVSPSRQGIVCRYSSSSNYWIATRTALQKVVGGTLTTVFTYPAPVADGQRLTVKCTGSTWTLWINAVQVTGTPLTDSALSSNTVFGLAVVNP